MKGSTLLQTLAVLGIESSHSRPRVSNDNAYAESILKTCKYRPDYPYKGFSTLDEARKWFFDFVQWYNYEHKHSRLKFVTPVQRPSGLDNQILLNRREVYERVKQEHPERWSSNTRNCELENEAWLNPEKVDRSKPETFKKTS